jgi:1-acyl-sn-glycerol-3-phosphate acyltransferase
MANGAETVSLGAVSPVRLFRAAWGAVATLACVLMTGIMGIPTAVIARLGYWRTVTFLSTVWARALLFFCGVRLEIVGSENLQGIGHYVLVCNHQSFFDIFAIAAYMPGPMRFVAKKELMKIPVVGYAMKHGGHVIIDRQAGGKEIRKAIEVVRKGYNLGVFAEGHRYSDNRVHEFEDGAAWLAALTKLPVVPMAISGSGAIFPRGAKIVVPGGRIRMTIGEPIPTANLKSSDRSELTHKLEEAVRAMFVEEL